MRKSLLLTVLLAVLTVSQGCEVAVNSNEFTAVNLTTISKTSGALMDAEVKTKNPAHNYSTGNDGFVQLLAKYGQDVLTAEINFWTLPPSVWRSISVNFRLSNKAVDYRIGLQDDPYRAAKISPNAIVLTTEFADGIERPATPVTITIERRENGGNWQPANVTVIDSVTIEVE